MMNLLLVVCPWNSQHLVQRRVNAIEGEKKPLSDRYQKLYEWPDQQFAVVSSIAPKGLEDYGKHLRWMIAEFFPW